jgi:hypothetical protein
MKRVRHSPGIENPNRCGKGAIQSTKQIVGWNPRIQGEAGHLGQRVHSRICAARALRQWGFARNAAESILKLTLDRAFAGLDLPSAVVGAIVGEGQFPRLLGSRRLRRGFRHGLGICDHK